MQRSQTACRLSAVLFVGALIGLLAPACGGMSLEEATALCDADQERLLTCPDETYDQCITCHQDCGSACTLVDTQGGATTCTYVCE